MTNFNINKFITSLKKDGVQRPHRYDILLTPTSNSQLFFRSLLIGDNLDVRGFNELLSERVTKVTHQGMNLSTKAIKTTGIDYEVPYQLNFEQNLSITLLADQNNKLRSFFTKWMHSIYNPRLGRFMYQKDYAFDLDVIMQSDLDGEDEKNDNTRTRFIAVYPKNISAIELDGTNSEALVDFTVQLTYHYYTDLRSETPSQDSLALQDRSGNAPFTGLPPS